MSLAGQTRGDRGIAACHHLSSPTRSGRGRPALARHATLRTSPTLPATGKPVGYTACRNSRAGRERWLTVEAGARSRTEGQEGRGGGAGLARPRARGEDRRGRDRTVARLPSTLRTGGEAGRAGRGIRRHKHGRRGRALSGHGLDRLLGYLVRALAHRRARDVERRAGARPRADAGVLGLLRRGALARVGRAAARP